MQRSPPTLRTRPGRAAALLLALCAAGCGGSGAAAPVPAVEIGTRLELFVDDALSPVFGAGTSRVLHRPTAHEVVLVTDAAWEGNTSAYYTVFRDGDLFRMYYRGSQSDPATGALLHGEHTCYAESSDGITWTKPSLGKYAFDGSTANNIVWDGIGTHCFAVFRDDNPAATPAAQYKAVAWGLPLGSQGLYAYESPNGIDWTQVSSFPVITTGDFDSQNVAFWDAAAGTYREYHRLWSNGIRTIMTSTSPDFRRWSTPQILRFPSVPAEHLYTNAVRPYARAPHILLGFPTRFLPDEGNSTEPTFMASRDGVTFTRYLDPLILRTDPLERDGNRSNYMAWGMVEIPGRPDHWSMYATEAFGTGTETRLRRFEFRKDGFVSIRGDATGGDVRIGPVRIDPAASTLEINAVTQGAGEVLVGFESRAGTPFNDLGVGDADPITGDQLAHVVHWGGTSDLSSLRGQEVYIRFRLTDADVFALRFRP